MKKKRRSSKKAKTVDEEVLYTMPDGSMVMHQQSSQRRLPSDVSANKAIQKKHRSSKRLLVDASDHSESKTPASPVKQLIKRLDEWEHGESKQPPSSPVKHTTKRLDASDHTESKQPHPSPVVKHTHKKKPTRNSNSNSRRPSDASTSPRHLKKPPPPPPPPYPPPPLGPPPIAPPMNDESLSLVSKTTVKHSNHHKVKKKKKHLKAPAPPGSDYSQEEAMEPSHPGSASDGRREIGIPGKKGLHHGPVSNNKAEEARQRKSFTKAVVAAAVSDATVHGRPFGQKDVRHKEAMSVLSSDPACSQYLHSMGQSFKTKAKTPPTSPQRRGTANNNSSSAAEQQLVMTDGSSSTNRRGSFFMNRSSIQSASVPGSPPLSPLFPGHHDHSASGAAKEALEESETNPELKFKIQLLESLFDDMDEKLSPGRPESPSARVDEGDAKVGGRRPSRANKSQVIVPPRDIEKDVSLIKEAPFDLENGRASLSDDMTKSITQRRSSVSSLSGIFRMDDYGLKRRIHCLIGLAIVIVFGMIAVVVLFEMARNDNSGGLDMPTMAPTSFKYDVLPDYTLLAFGYPASPQSRAYYWLENDVNRGDLSAGVALQRFVLATLFYATRGDHWSRNLSWMAYPESECDWYNNKFNSICNGARQLHTLSLPDNALQGTIPEELELLSSLNIVELQNNDLHGKFPRRIWSSWKHLVFLNLQNNSLSGTLPSDIGALAIATNLNTLNLRSNQFSGYLPTELGLLKVEFMSLSGNRFSSTLPTELGTLLNLEDLYLYDNSFRGTIPSTLGQLSKLTRLELHNNNLSGSVPQELCDLLYRGNLTTLTVDCARVRCTCGCDCTATMEHFEVDTVFDKDDGSQ